MLNEKELQNLKEQLEKEAGELEAQLKRHKGDTDFGSDIDHGDEEADEAEEYSNDLGIKDALKEQLINVESALDKMTRNEYGKCEKCGMEISLEVLNADPESRLCKECKLKK